MALFTTGKLAMGCPLCNDFLINSKKYVIENLSANISKLADIFAQKEASAHLDMYLDFYMLYYRREYERLFEEKKESVLEQFKILLTQRYSGHPRLCNTCKVIYAFDSTAQFCFHGSDSSCSNCST